MKVIIDRFEGLYAICEKEDGTMIEIELNKIPEGGKEGVVLNIKNDKVSIDIVKTKERQKEIAEQVKDMWV